jgi:hypothetical protein
VHETHIGHTGVPLVDGVLDAVGADFSGLLRAGGRYVSVVPGMLPAASSLAGREATVVVTRESGPMLDDLARMVERAELRLPEPRIFGLEDVCRAHEEFHKRTGQRIVLVR